MDAFRKIIDLLSRRERLYLALLFVAVLVMAFLEMVSVASILPFLAVAADPSKIQTNAWLSWAYEVFNFDSTNGFLLFLAGVALLALVLSNAWMAATHWAQLRFAHARSHSLEVRLLRHYLALPYVFFLRRNSADLGKNILSEVGQATSHIIVPSLLVTAKAIVAVAIVVVLIIFDPLLALVVTGVLGGAYGAISLHVRHRLARLGEARVAANSARHKAAYEAFGAIKDLKLIGGEDAFVSRFIRPSRSYVQCQATAAIIAAMPRYALEVLAFGGVLVVAMYLIGRGEALQEAIPVLGLYAFAGYRLMPSLQQIFQGYTRLRFGAPALDNLHRELTKASPAPDAKTLAIRRSNGRCNEILPLTERLELEGVTFTYPGAHKPALRDATLVIDANSTVGLVGPTGSGKTTLVDVILGLLRAQVGEIRVDGVLLTDANLRAWQNCLGYVPQHIYLSDDTIARNVAFGVPDDQIDQSAVERAARVANIHEFIKNELPEGYDTVVGERGIRLSGGQRQRIGIARALYHSPSVLVLDEATNALDYDTEAAVMDAIHRLAGQITIIMVTHRLVITKDHCHSLYWVEGGAIRSCSLPDTGRRAQLRASPTVELEARHGS